MTESTEQEVAEFKDRVESLRLEIHKVIVGQDEILEHVLIGLFAGGHVLLEGVPGLGKTLLIRTLAQSLDLGFSRIQFTPDLMPADITGTNIVVEDQAGRRSFDFQKGPVFSNVVLADEINRATPKTQSALLEAMQDGTVTLSGHSHELPHPFYVLATQNPIEMEGTYPLPEAQLDRFVFKLVIKFPAKGDLLQVLDQTTGTETASVNPVINAEQILQMRHLSREVLVAGQVAEYVAGIVMATHPDDPGAPDSVRRYLRFGASPRGGQSILLAAKVRALIDGRYNVSFEDVKAMAKPALRHRIILNFEGEAEGRTPDDLLDDVIAEVQT